MRRKCVLLVCATLCCALLVACGAIFSRYFSVRQITPLPDRTYAFASDVNNFGAAVGASFSSSLPFRASLWHNGQVTDLGTLGGTYSAARAINDQNQIVGESKLAGDTAQHAFLWRDGKMEDLGTLGGEQSQANDINAHGQIVGWSWDASVALPKAVLWQDGVMQPLPTPPEVELSFASGINDSGTISGTAVRGGSPVAVRWVDGKMSYLGTLGGDGSYGNGINGRGEVVGWSRNAAGGLRGFLWRNGAMIDLGILPNGDSSVAMAVNDLSEVAMTATVDGKDRAALWRNGELVDLSDFVPEKFAPLTGVAYGINQLNQIVVTSDANDALLLTPAGRHH